MTWFVFSAFKKLFLWKVFFNLNKYLYDSNKFQTETKEEIYLSSVLWITKTISSNQRNDFWNRNRYLATRMRRDNQFEYFGFGAWFEVIAWYLVHLFTRHVIQERSCTFGLFWSDTRDKNIIIKKIIKIR